MDYSYNDFIIDLRMGSEIEFTYKDISYFIFYDNRGIILMKIDDKSKQIFKNDDEFLEKAVIDSKRICELWDDIIIVTIY